MSSEKMDTLANWKPKPSTGLVSDINKYGWPTIIYRIPSKLVEECERAFDEGFLIAALTLAVTIPDVCARIAESSYLEWSRDYLNLSYYGKKMATERSSTKSREEIDDGFKAIVNRGIFTASDLYQLRCAILHTGSALIDGTGKDYTPYRNIGVCVTGDADKLIVSYGHRGSGPVNQQTECAYNCSITLEGLISRIARGVRDFIEEDPSRDREYSDKDVFFQRGLIDFRTLS